MNSSNDKTIYGLSELTFLDVAEGIQSHAIVGLTAAGLIVAWNKGAEMMTGWQAAEVIGRPIDILFADDGSTSVLHDNLAEATQNGGFQKESRLVTKSGGSMLADLSITAVRSDGALQGFVAVAKDTTQRKKNEDEQLDANALLRREIDRRKAIEKALQESNEELDAFASAAGHDLQEPLRMVVSYLQLLERRYAKSFDQDGMDFLAFAIDGASRMKMLINDLVEYSRIETLGKPFKDTDANAVLKEVLSSMEVSITETKARVTYDDLPTVWSDKVQLNELFQNLIANAIKFGVKGKKKPLKINIGVETKPKEYIFSVSDNGPGIAKKDFKTIFLIFKQLGNKLQSEGSGIGLAICKKIVKRHKGRIWVESVLGEYTTFKFSIPRVKEKHE